MSIPASTPCTLTVPPHPDRGVESATDVIACGTFDHDARNLEDSYSKAVHDVANGDSSRVAAFTNRLNQSIQSVVSERFDRSVIVPFHHGGTNDAMEHIATRLQPPYTSILERTREVAANKTIPDADQRWANVADSITVTEDVTGETILVLDDVVASGASLGTTAATLKDAGTTTVQGAVLGVRVPNPYDLTFITVDSRTS